VEHPALPVAATPQRGAGHSGPQALESLALQRPFAQIGVAMQPDGALLHEYPPQSIPPRAQSLAWLLRSRSSWARDTAQYGSTRRQFPQQL